MIVDTMPLVSIYVVLNSFSSYQWTVMNATRMQKEKLMTFFFCYYAIGIPTGGLLGLKFGYGLKGIILGNILADALVIMIQAYIVFNIDIEQKTREAHERISDEKKLLSKPVEE